MTLLEFDLPTLGFALFLATALIVLPLAIIITLVLIHLFRRQVEHSMRATANTPAAEVLAPLSGRLPVDLGIDRFDAMETKTEPVCMASLLTQARRHARKLAMIYAGATLVYPFVLAVVMILAIGFVPEQYVTLKFAILFGLLFVLNATPLVLAPTLVLKKQISFLALSVLILVFVLWTLDTMIGTDGIGLWLLIAGVPTGAILLFNLRRLRAVGPLVFAATLLFFYGVVIGLASATFYVLDVVGPVRFVRDDLAHISFYEASMIWVQELWRFPPAQFLDRIQALIDNPFSIAYAEHREQLTTQVKLYFFGILFVGVVLGAVFAGILLRSVALRYRARHASDQMLAIDILMLIFILLTSLLLFSAYGWIEMVAVLAVFAGYKGVLRWLIQRRENFMPPAIPRTLLLLRVFGFDRRTQRLLEDLGQYWRYLGPIRLIGGRDLAYTTLEPYEFFEFLNRRLSRAFIKDQDDLECRLSGTAAKSDPDGLFRVESFFCHNETWRMTVSHLANEADAVLMDLRGFTPKHQGCVFEIEQLIASVPLQSIVILTDRSTDGAFLEQTLQRAWHTMPADSPNMVADEHRIRILQASSSNRCTLNKLLSLLTSSSCERDVVVRRQ